MDALQHLTLDPTPWLCVLLLSGGFIATLRAVETWAGRRAKRQTLAAIEAVERDRAVQT